MEEKKKVMWKKIAERTIITVVGLLVLGCVFALSVPAGIAAVLFATLGFFVGWFARSNRELKKFLDAVLEHKEEFFEGKTIVAKTDDETGEFKVYAVDTEKPAKKKKKEEAQE